jgi:hypothetical protein
VVTAEDCCATASVSVRSVLLKKERAAPALSLALIGCLTTTNALEGASEAPSRHRRRNRANAHDLHCSYAFQFLFG